MYKIGLNCKQMSVVIHLKITYKHSIALANENKTFSVVLVKSTPVNPKENDTTSLLRLLIKFLLSTIIIYEGRDKHV